MKTVKIIILALLSTTLSVYSYAQTSNQTKVETTKTETIKVSGNCDMCKARIEKAAKFDGVSKVEWSTKDKTLTASFSPAKTNMNEIGKKVAAAGHDNEKVKAEDKVYDKLPGCCQYR